MDWVVTPLDDARFWLKVDTNGPVHPTDPSLGLCWLWTAALQRKGYGVFWLNPRLLRAHVYAYVTLVGPVPDGLELDHTCRRKACVNPMHVEPVTHAENCQRGVEARRPELIEL